MLNRESLSKQIYHLLKEIIILQKTPGFQMGEKINEAAIAKRFNCSVTPVREAINMLRQAGLIVGDSYQSSSIVSFNRRDAEDLFDIRECLEIWALEKALPLLSEEDKRGLRLAQEKYQRAYEVFDEEAIIRCNWEFHNILIQRANNRYLRQEINGLIDPVREHKAILAAIEGDDFQGAKAAMTTHLDRVKAEVLAMMDRTDW